MKGKYLRRLGGLLIATLLLFGIAFVSPSTAEAQRRFGGHRVVVVRRPFFGPFGFRGYYPYGYPYAYGYYNQYVFDNGDSAANQGYEDGFQTGKKDGQKNKSYNPERSHYYHDSGFGNFAE